MAKMLMAAFTEPAQADHALMELERFGYTPQEISVISKTNRYEAAGSRDAAVGGATVGESTLAGATTGAALGGLAGLLAGVGVIPALAGLFIGGPVAAALGLAGAAATTLSGAVTGAAAGGLIGALTGLGVPRDTAESYDRTVEAGGVVIGLTSREQTAHEARTILERNGAQNLIEFDARPQPDTATTNVEGPVTAANDTTADGNNYAPRRHEPAFGERRTTESDRRTLDNPREREED